MVEIPAMTFADLTREGILEVGDGHRAKLDELGGEGPYFLRAGALSASGLDWSGLDSFLPEVAERLGSKQGRPGDVVITTKGNSIGRVGWVPGSAPEFVYSPHLSYWRSLDERVLAPRFLYYWSRSEVFAQQLRRLAFGTDMAPYLSLRDQARLTIQLPAIGDQRAIAEVLGALDDKIDANSRLRTLSDDLLRARFDAATQDASWGVLSDVAWVNRRAVKPGPGELRYIDIAAVGVGTFEFPDRTLWSEAPGRARRGVRPGDTLWSTVRPNRRSHALVLDSGDDLVASTGLAVLTPIDGRFAFVFEATRTAQFSAYVESVAEGSAYPAVRAERFNDAPVPILEPEALERFEADAAALRRRVHAAEAESRILAETRDALLPLLMSGRVRVKDAEEAVEGVV